MALSTDSHYSFEFSLYKPIHLPDFSVFRFGTKIYICFYKLNDDNDFLWQRLTQQKNSRVSELPPKNVDSDAIEQIIVKMFLGVRLVCKCQKCQNLKRVFFLELLEYRQNALVPNSQNNLENLSYQNFVKLERRLIFCIVPR